MSLYQLEHKAPADAQRLVNKGVTELKHGRYQTSLDLFTKALKIDPDYWVAETDVGCLYLKVHKVKQAESSFQKAIDIDPENPVGYSNLGVAEFNLGEVHLAEQSAKRALQLSTLDQARALLGITEIAQGHWTPYARRLLEEAKTSIPDIDRVLEAWPESHSKEPKRLTINLGVR